MKKVSGAILVLALLALSASAFAAVYPVLQFVSFDQATFTYTYRVTCPANSTYPFGRLTIMAEVPQAGIYYPWGHNADTAPTTSWDFYTVDRAWDPGWNPIKSNAVWAGDLWDMVPANTAWSGQFILTVPNSFIVEAIGIHMDGGPWSESPGVTVYVPGPGPIPAGPGSDAVTVKWGYGAELGVKVGTSQAASSVGTVKAGLTSGNDLEYEIEDVSGHTALRMRRHLSGGGIVEGDLSGIKADPVRLKLLRGEVRYGAGFGTNYEFPAPLDDPQQAALASLLMLSDAYRVSPASKPAVAAVVSGLVDFIGSSYAAQFMTEVGCELYGSASLGSEYEIGFGLLQLWSTPAVGVETGFRAYLQQDMGSGSSTKGIEAYLQGTTLLPSWMVASSASGEAGIGFEVVQANGGDLSALNIKASLDTSVGVPFVQPHDLQDFTVTLTPQHCAVLRNQIPEKFVSRLSTVSGCWQMALDPVGQSISGIVEPALITAIKAVGPAHPVVFKESHGTETVVKLNPSVDIPTPYGFDLHLGFEAVGTIGEEHLARTAQVQVINDSLVLGNEEPFVPVGSQWTGMSGIVEFHKQLLQNAVATASPQIASYLPSVAEAISDATQTVVDAAQGTARVIGDGAKWLTVQAQGVQVKITSWWPSVGSGGAGSSQSAALMRTMLGKADYDALCSPYRSANVVGIAPRALRARSTSATTDQQDESVTIIGPVHRVEVTDSEGAVVTEYPAESTQVEITISTADLAAAKYKTVDKDRLRLYRYDSVENTWYEIASASVVDPQTGDSVLTTYVDGPGDYAAGIVGAPTDEDPPTVSIASPASGSTLTGAVTVTGTCDDDVAVAFVALNVGELLTVDAIIEGNSWLCDIDTLRFASGEKTLIATATDAEGHTTSASVSVQINNPGFGNIASAKHADQPYVNLANTVVTAGTNVLPGFFYIQNMDAPFGVKVVPQNANVEQGDVLNVAGFAETVDGECQISAADIVTVRKGDPIPRPLALISYAIGGGPWGLQMGISGAYGLNNTGLLLRCWGSFTSIDEHAFTIDDGGDCVKCVVPDGVTLDSNWTYVIVTGISSCEQVGEEIHRLVRVRQQNDIVGY